MPKMRLTPEALLKASADIAQCQADQENILSTVQGLIDEVVSEWEGQAQKKFINAWEEKKPAYQQFAPDMSKFSEFLNNYANTMEAVDAGATMR